MDEFHRELGQNIYTHRKAIKMSSTRLSELAGISQSTISKIENGVQTPHFHTVLKLCEALGVTLYDIVPEKFSKHLTVAPIDPLRSQLFSILNNMSENELELAFNYVLTFLQLDINSTTLNSISVLVKSFESLSEKDRQYLITTFNSISNK